MIINHNMNAMNAHRLMTGNTSNAGRSMEKLSSGLRINRAGDDAAGLAISEKMRGQIRGLDQASRNSQDGISMIQTAEGALGETHSILQRMRELATQSANSTNVAVDRTEIQKEMNQLTTEINRIGNTTEFNTQKVLAGSDSGLVLKDALSLAKTGNIANTALAGGVTTAPQAASVTVTAVAISAGATGIATDTMVFNLNGKQITATFAVNTAATAGITAASGISNSTATGFTIEVASGLTATALADRLRAGLQASINLDSNLVDKGYKATVGTGASDTALTITTGTDTGAQSFVNVQANDNGVANGTQVLQQANTLTIDFGADVNYTAATAQISLLGVTAGAATALAGQGFTIGDKTVEFYDASKGLYTGKADYAVNIKDVIDAGANSATALVDAIVTQIGTKVEGFTLSTGAAVTDLKISSTLNGEAGNDLKVADGVDVAATKSKAFNATLQVGANKGQGLTVEIGDMRARSLNITGTAGSNATEGAKFTSANNVTNGTDNTVTEASLDVSSYENATAAIKVINNAIESVSAERSKLGAYQNRLEHTIANLGTSSENLTAAESRVRDVDMAKEMMNFSKSNILSQAAQAMLAQANQQPQGVLQLLR